MNGASNVISTLDRFQKQFAKVAFKETIGIKKMLYAAKQILIFK